MLYAYRQEGGALVSSVSEIVFHNVDSKWHPTLRKTEYCMRTLNVNIIELNS